MKTNEDKILEITNKVYLRICNFYQERMIHVPRDIFNIIWEETKQGINQSFPNKYAVKSLRYMARRVRVQHALSALLYYGCEKVWTIHELAQKVDMSESGIHKLKYRLLYLGLVDMSDTTKGRTRFKLNEKGEKEIKELGLYRYNPPRIFLDNH